MKLIPCLQYLDLVAKVKKIDKKAAKWMLTQKAIKLSKGEEATSRPHLTLCCTFVWENSPQGHKYWANLARKLGEFE